jgi:RNA polymerase sigma-32 factor
MQQKWLHFAIHTEARLEGAKIAAQLGGNENGVFRHPIAIREGVSSMRIMTAYLMEGRGQAADGRRKATAALVLDDAPDAVETPYAEEALDAEWSEDESLPASDDEPAAAASATKSQAPAERDPYAAYMASLRNVDRLDRDQEHELAVAYRQSHDPEIARKLITANLKLVVKLAHEYSRAHRNLLDLIQEGNVGLVQAVEKYDPDRGVKLSSYAAWWIRAYMLRWLLQNARMVRLGTTATQRKLFFNLRKEKAKLEKRGFVPSPENVAKAMRLPEAEVAEMDERLSGPDASLDAPIDRDDHGRSRLDVLESAMPRPDDVAESDEFRERLHQALASFGARLKGRERQLFNQRLMTDEPRTLQELGDDFGISRERTRQLEMRLLGRLKTHLRARLGDAIDAQPAAQAS